MKRITGGRVRILFSLREQDEKQKKKRKKKKLFLTTAKSSWFERKNS